MARRKDSQPDDRKPWWRRWRLGDERRSRWSEWAQIIGLLVGIAALAATIYAIASSRGNGSEASVRNPREAGLRSVGLTVNNNATGRQQGQGIELLLQNTGTGRSVVSEAQIEVKRLDRLPLCFTQGELPLSERYGALLPSDARPGEVVKAPLHQQLAADRADRFELALGLDPDPAELDVEGKLPGVYLFELDVSVSSDGKERPLEVGKALVSLPELPTPFGVYLWSPSTPRFLATNFGNPDGRSAEELWSAYMPCWRKNTAALRRALAQLAARSPSMEALGREIVTPSYAAIEKWLPLAEEMLADF